MTGSLLAEVVMLRRALGLVVALGLCGGCALPAAILYKTVGPPKVPARYAPPKEPMLVLVEEASAGLGYHVETEELALALSEELVANSVAPMVDVREVHRLRDAGPAAFRQMGIAQIGREVGAKQVLYVALKRVDFEAPDQSDMQRARVAIDVKVVDTATQSVRWPITGEAEMYEYESPYGRLTAQRTRAMMRRDTVDHMAREVARWFYSWRPETMGEENQEEKIR